MSYNVTGGRKPLAPLLDANTLAPYFDASRELQSPQSSGFGAWALVGGEFCYLEGRWSAWELRTLSINVLELATGTSARLRFSSTRGTSELK